MSYLSSGTGGVVADTSFLTFAFDRNDASRSAYRDQSRSEKDQVLRVAEEEIMQTSLALPVEDCLIEVLQHLGLATVHVAAAGSPALTDWFGIATRYPDRIASLTVIAPPIVDECALGDVASRLLAIAGDQGVNAQGAIRLAQRLPGVSAHALRNYEYFPWTDVIADRGAEVGRAMMDFIDHHPVPAAALPEIADEVSNVSYRIRGSGPPLVLLPLALAPSQWDHLLPQFAERYCAISLGGPLLGAVGVLEARGCSNYLMLIRNMLDLARIRPGDVVLEVGGGSGVVLREIARRTLGANEIIDIDISPYLLREAAALAQREGLADSISFREGAADDIPLADASVDVALSFTVMEEGDSDKMLGELVRVTRPGGRIAAVVRALDMPSWANLSLTPATRAKTDRPVNVGVAANGCADASLYRRFREVGLTELTCFPQLANVTHAERSRFQGIQQRIVSSLTAAEVAEWQVAAAQAEADGTLFFASGYHCAVGTKP
jgi:ubiquinone/menaquinone biosynthesis C-methylase UbiE